MLFVVMCAALSQAPVKVAVVQSSNLGVSAKRTAELTKALLELMVAEGLVPLEAKLPCDGRACLLARGRELQAAGVISVAFAAIGKDTVMDLEGVQISDGKPLGQTTFTAKPGEARLPFESTAFVAELGRGLLAAAASPVVADVPKPPPRLVPDQTQPPPPELIVERPEHSRVPAIAISVVAIGAGVAAVVLLALASSEAREANRVDPAGSTASVYDHGNARALQVSANRKYTTSLSFGIGAGVLAATAMVLFVY